MTTPVIAGADELGAFPEFGDMGNEVPDTPAADVTPPAVEPPAVDTPPAAAPTPPADVVPPATPPVVPPVVDPAKGKNDEPPVKGKPDFLDRLATKNEKIRQREERIAALEQELQQARAVVTPPATATPPAAPVVTEEITALRGQIADLRGEYHKAVMDGNTKAMAALDDQIDALREQILDKQVESRTAVIEERVSSTLTERQQALQVNAAVNELQAEYAELDADAAEYDEILVGMVNARAAQLKSAGKPFADALRTAAGEVMSRYRGVAAAPADTTIVTPPATRAVDAQKNLAAAAAQPTPPPAAVSTASQVGKVDIMRVSEAEMAKWTEEDWARVRGDTLE